MTIGGVPQRYRQAKPGAATAAGCKPGRCRLPVGMQGGLSPPGDMFRSLRTTHAFFCLSPSSWMSPAYRCVRPPPAPARLLCCRSTACSQPALPCLDGRSFLNSLCPIAWFDCLSRTPVLPHCPRRRPVSSATRQFRIPTTLLPSSASSSSHPCSFTSSLVFSSSTRQ